MPAQDPAKALAREIYALRREVNALSRGSQLAHSSLTVDGEEVTLPAAVRNATTAQADASLARVDAAAAQAAAVTATSTAADAATRADDAEAAALEAAGIAADKGKIVYTETAPTGDANTLWIPPPDNIPHRWDGNAWVVISDTGIATAQGAADQALADAADAQATADGKVRTFFQTTEPTGMLAGDVGDLWFDTDDGNKLYRWSGSAWTATTYGAAAIAATARQLGSITTYYQTAQPASGMLAGDLWVDTDDGNKLYRYGTSWVAVRDTGIAAAATAAANAQTAADAAATAAQTAQNTANAAQGDATTALSTASGKNTVTYSDHDPDIDGIRAGDLWWKLTAGKLVGTWTWTGAAPWVAVQFADAVLATLSAAKITTGELAAGQTVYAGPQTAAHGELSATGLHFFDLDPDGQVVAGSGLGTGGSDRLLITDGAGHALATVASDGTASFASVSTGSLTVAGDSLQTTNDRMARGLLVRAGVTASLPTTTSARGAYDVEFLAEPGRAYRIHTSPLNLNPSTTSTYVYACLTVRPSAAGPPSVADGKPIVAARGSTNLTGGVAPITLDVDVSFDELFPSTPPTEPTLVRVLLVYGVVSGGGNVGIFSAATYPTHTYVEDIGLAVPFTGVMNDGGGSTGTPVTTQTLDFATTWGRSYCGNGTERSATDFVQGYTSYYPAGGCAISLLGFTDLTATLAGATINWAALYMNATHWTNYSGGTVILGTHSWLNDTGATAPGSGLSLNQLLDPGWQRPDGRWVYLPASWFAGLISGTTRGFTLGDLASTSAEYYGRFVSTGNGRPVLRVNFTK